MFIFGCCCCCCLQSQIDRLKEEKTIIQAKYRYHCENSGVNQLKTEVKSLQTTINEYKSKLSQTTYHYEDIRAKYDELKIKTDMKEEMQKTVTTTDAFAQTEPMTGATFVEQMDWDRLKESRDTYKTQYRACVHAYNELKEIYKKLFEQNATLQQKYDRTKEICNKRFKLLNENEEKMVEFKRKIEELNQNEVNLKDELVALKQKYEESVDIVVYKQLKAKYDEIEVQHSKYITKCLETANTLNDFKAKYNRIKTENDSLKKFEEQYTIIADEMKLLNEKYAHLKKQKLELDVYRNKYNSAKDLLEKRFYRIQYLEGKLNTNGVQFKQYYEKNNENVSNVENVPNNN